MNLQTTVNIPPPKEQINHLSRILLVGSCFTENMGKKFSQYKLKSFFNPCGIAYNPVSVAQSIQFLTRDKKLQEADLIFDNKYWHSLHHHGSFSSKQKEQLLENIQYKLHEGRFFLKSATHVFLTLGTAWVFRHLMSGQIVNNCHKLKARDFERQRLSTAETTKWLRKAILQIHRINPTAEIIFTVSPVRHQKDGLHENQLSKATLLLALENLLQYKNVQYFPAYEIVMDELRDYRFFTEDFCHINTLGIHYIWEKLKTTYIHSEAQKHFSALEKLQRALQHKIQDPDSLSSEQFRAKVMTQITNLEKQLPNVDFTEEKEWYNNNYQ